MTRSRNIGRGRSPGSRRTQFGRGGKRPEQHQRRKRATEREATGATAPIREEHGKRGIGWASGTPRDDPGISPIMRRELLDLIRRDRVDEVEGLRRELALARGRLDRCAEAIGAALAARDFGAVRAVLAAALGVEEAERPRGQGRGPAEAGTARPTGDAGDPADHGVPLPAGKRDAAEEPGQERRGRRTTYNGVEHVPIPDSWGGAIVSGTPRRRGIGIPADPYGDSGPLSADD